METQWAAFSGVTSHLGVPDIVVAADLRQGQRSASVSWVPDRKLCLLALQWPWLWETQGCALQVAMHTQGYGLSMGQEGRAALRPAFDHFPRLQTGECTGGCMCVHVTTCRCAIAHVCDFTTNGV